MLAGALPLAVAGCVREYSLPCVYVGTANPDDPTPELRPHPSCAEVGPDGEPRIAPRHLAAANYDDGLASLLIAGDWYYVRSDGASLRVVTFDNGPDWWAEGLVRSVRDGKIAYLDRAFEEVIPPRYDWGWPFDNGRALVCIGCREGDPVGEHRPIVGGRWGYIDRSGDEVVPVRLSRSEALELPLAQPTEGEP